MRKSMRRSSRAFGAVVAGGAMVLAACNATGQPLHSVTPEPGPGGAPAPATTTVSALARSIWQTNDSVWALAYSSGILYAGGDFTQVSPPAGSSGNAVTTGLAALDASTGAPHDYGSSTFSTHTFNGRIEALTISGNTLYVGGTFTSVDGQTRNKAAAFDISSPNAPSLLSWNPNLSGPSGSGPDVRAIAVSGTSVYLGGAFSTVGALAQARLAKVDATTGAADTNFRPDIDSAVTSNVAVNALLVAPRNPQGEQNLIVGGKFEHVNGQHLRALAAVDLATGDNGKIDNAINNDTGTPLIPTKNCADPNCQTRSDVKALATDGANVFVGAEGTGASWFDGTLAFDPTTGRQVWRDACLGATQALTVLAGKLYIGSHAHDCSSIGTFGQLPIIHGSQSGGSVGDQRAWHHLTVEQTGDGKMLDWFPNTNAGPGQAGATEVGPRAMATDGSRVFVGGQFTQVGFSTYPSGTLVGNGGSGAPTSQRGLAVFGPGNPTAAPLPVTNLVAKRVANGRAIIQWAGSYDPDSSSVVYKLYRDNVLLWTSAPQWAHFWQQGLFRVRDNSFGSGPHTYRVDVTDNATTTSSSNVAVPSSPIGTGYKASVLASHPNTYWRVDETTGTIAADSSGKGNTGTYSGGMNRGILGAVPSDRAIHLGPDGSVLSNADAIAAPKTFAVSLWFRTTTKTGGRLIGFGNQQSSTSTVFDRQLYMSNNGQLIFGTFDASANPRLAWLTSPVSYNDGYWHYVVASMDGTNGLQLFVDGQRVADNNTRTTGQTFNGWWRVGVDQIGSWPARPTSNGIAADIDEVAFYPSPLTASTLLGQMLSE